MNIAKNLVIASAAARAIVALLSLIGYKNSLVSLTLPIT